MEIRAIEDHELRLGNICLDANGNRHDIINGWQIDEGVELFGVPLTEEILLKVGYKFYNGKTEGDLCMNFGGKLDIDFINGKIQVKSHYEEYSMYRPIFGIEYLHQLQNLYFALNQTELEVNL